MTTTFKYGLHLAKWQNNLHPDNPNFTQKVFWIGDWDPSRNLYKIGYHLGDFKTKWVYFGHVDCLKSFQSLCDQVEKELPSLPY